MQNCVGVKKKKKSNVFSFMYIHPNGHLDIRPSDDPLPKKPPFMRVWVRSPETSKYTCMCKFRLEFLSYLNIYIYIYIYIYPNAYAHVEGKNNEF
jgi:hypothetical protein